MTTMSGLFYPKKQGLYDPEFEHELKKCQELIKLAVNFSWFWMLVVSQSQKISGDYSMQFKSLIIKIIQYSNILSALIINES